MTNNTILLLLEMRRCDERQGKHHEEPCTLLSHLHKNALDALPELTAELQAAAECVTDKLDEVDHSSELIRLESACKHFLEVYDQLSTTELIAEFVTGTTQEAKHEV